MMQTWIQEKNYESQLYQLCEAVRLYIGIVVLMLSSFKVKYFGQHLCKFVA